jgi:HTH-type transcriptional regulator/antitoxin HigA
MMPTVERTINGWTPLADTLIVPHTEAEHERLVAMLDELIDTVGEDEDHLLAGLMETVGVLVENYEDRHIPEPEGDPLTTLRLLMDEHGIEASALTEIGSERAVRQILDGTAALTMPQIRLLAQRFHVSPATFL